MGPSALSLVPVTILTQFLCSHQQSHRQSSSPLPPLMRPSGAPPAHLQSHLAGQDHLLPPEPQWDRLPPNRLLTGPRDPPWQDKAQGRQDRGHKALCRLQPLDCPSAPPSDRRPPQKYPMAVTLGQPDHRPTRSRLIPRGKRRKMKGQHPTPCQKCRGSL